MLQILRRLVQQPLSLNLGLSSHLNIDSVGALLRLLELFNLTPPAHVDTVAFDDKSDRIDEVGECSVAKQENVFRRTGVVIVFNVRKFERADEDVAASYMKGTRAYRCRRSLSVGPAWQEWD